MRPTIPRDELPSPKPDPAVERAEDPDRPDLVEAPRSDGNRRQSLRIAELKLIRKVDRVGSFEPLDTSALMPGREVLLYCEMAGLEYQACGDQFVSRLSSHLELRADGGGPIVWEQALPTAEDIRRRPPHDYFVWYRIKLPQSLEPGSYRVRLVGTDLIAERTTSADFPLTIAK